MAVAPQLRGRGVGTLLLDRVVRDLTESGCELVEVKTLDAGAGYEPYLATRVFWERRGFVQIDMIDPLPGWQPGNPAAIYVAALTATRVDIRIARPGRGAGHAGPDPGRSPG